VLCEFVREGHFERHLRRMRALYTDRLSIFIELIERHLATELEIVPATTGLQTVGWLRSERPDREVAKAVWAQGVETIPMSRYRIERPLRSGLHFGFGGFDRTAMQDGVARLVRAFHEVTAPN
jgi:GntR family transcriptional regulator/MocR family aminotransferase